MPRISVVMSVKNGAPFVHRAIESMLRQTYKDFELLVLDNGSTDGTARIVKRYAKDKRIRYIDNHGDIGFIPSLNKGLRLSRGEFIARMDADDIAMPQRFKEQVTFLDKHPEIAIVGTWADIVDMREHKIGELRYGVTDAEIRARMMQRDQFIHPSTMFRKTAVKKIGVYNETFHACEDYEYFGRMLSQFQSANIPKRLMKYSWNIEGGQGFTAGKKQERNALRARWWLLTRYGWPAWHAIYMIKPLITFCIPAFIKRRIVKMIVRRKLKEVEKRKQK